MDIHRCQFVPYPRSTINVLAFSHSYASRERKADNLRLAIGRANGDIEIWNPLNGAWLQETVLPGGKDRSVDGLVWTQDPDGQDAAGNPILGKLRLFSVGYTTTVTEWDLEKGQPLRQSSGNHGQIWCLAAQPQFNPSEEQQDEATGLWQGQNLVAGCTDGAIAVYSTADQDLKLRRVLVRPSARKAKVISITFQDRRIIVAGCTDSTIRLYWIQNGALLRSISLGAGPAGGPREIIVWTVKCLPVGHIISGDSTGELRIWDGMTYALLQRIKGHRQDILSLATSVDGATIFSGGMDRRTVVYKQFRGPSSRWTKVTHRRFHSDDVKTMATFEGNGMSIVASGGPDACPTIIPLREFGLENHRTLSCLPQEPPVRSAPKERLIMSWWDREVYIWRFGNSSNEPRVPPQSQNDSSETHHTRKLVAGIFVNDELNLTSASITADGSLLAVSTSGLIRVMGLSSRGSGANDLLNVRLLQIPPLLSAGGGRLVRFSPDRRWLAVVRRDNHIVMARIVDCGHRLVKVLPKLSHLKRLDRKIEKTVLLGGLGAYERTITRIDFSADSRIVAVGDLAGYIDTWILVGQEDLTSTAGMNEISNDASFEASSDDSDDQDGERRPTIVLGQHWIRNPSASLLPRLPSAPVVLAFRPTITASEMSQSNGESIPHPTRHNPYAHSQNLPQGEDRLVVVTATSNVLEFNILQGRLSNWSRRNPIANFPEDFKVVRDQAMGAVWDIADSKERLWLYGSSWLWMFDLSRDFPVESSVERPLTNGQADDSLASIGQSRPNKRRRTAQRDDSAISELTEGTSGAGSRVPEHQLLTGISRRRQNVISETESDDGCSMVNNYCPSVDMDVDGLDEANGDESTEPTLRRLRHGEDAALQNGQTSEGRNGYTFTSAHWWHTYKYRPMMGIVPIDGESGLEVALVELEKHVPARDYGE